MLSWWGCLHRAPLLNQQPEPNAKPWHTFYHVVSEEVKFGVTFSKRLTTTFRRALAIKLLFDPGVLQVVRLIGPKDRHDHHQLLSGFSSGCRRNRSSSQDTNDAVQRVDCSLFRIHRFTHYKTACSHCRSNCRTSPVLTPRHRCKN